MIYFGETDNTRNIKGIHILSTRIIAFYLLLQTIHLKYQLIYALNDSDLDMIKEVGSYGFDENYCFPKMVSQKLIPNCLLGKTFHYSSEYY